MEKMLRGLLGIFLIGMFLVPGAVFAETTGEVAALKAQIEALSRKLEAMDSKMMTLEKPAPGAQAVYIPSAPDEKKGLLRAMEDIHMGGYVETQFQNKVGEPQQNGNVGRSLTDKAADTFSMNAAKLWFEKLANPEGGAGFRIDMMMGSDVRYYFNNFQRIISGFRTAGAATRLLLSNKPMYSSLLRLDFGRIAISCHIRSMSRLGVWSLWPGMK